MTYLAVERPSYREEQKRCLCNGRLLCSPLKRASKLIHHRPTGIYLSMESDRLPDAVDLVFKGVDGAEAESFIRSVQRAARTEGRIRDNAWIADLVSTCMIGEALRWYVELDEDTQNDWKLLRKAILRQYPSRIQPSVPSSLPSVPTSAAATTPRNSTSLFRPSQAPKAIYRILLYFPSVEGAFFLSTDDKAQACLTKHDGRALNVHWTPGTALRLVRNVNSFTYLLFTSLTR